MHELTVATYNVFGAPFAGQNIKKTLLKTRVRKRLRIIGELLDGSDIDVLFFQEILFYHHLFILKRKLSHYPYIIFEPFIYGPKGGVAIFSKVPIEKEQFWNFNNTGAYWNKSVVGKIGRRGVLIAKLKDNPIYLLNTHLTQNSDHDWSLENRYANMLMSQLTEVGAVMQQCISDGTTVIAAGDFNMPKNSQYYKDFMQQNNLQDAFAKDDSPTYIEEYAKDPRSIIQEDYIFTSSSTGRFAQHSHIFVDKHKFKDGASLYLSDHVGLKATIKFGK